MITKFKMFETLTAQDVLNSDEMNYTQIFSLCVVH